MSRISVMTATLAATAMLALLPTQADAQLTGSAALTAQERANQKLVTDFWREVLQAKNPAAAAKYYSTDVIQHNPNVPGGLEGFQKFFGAFWRSPEPVKSEIDPAPSVLMTRGDLVLIVNKHTGPDPADPSKSYDSYWFDLFRVQGGKIVEHWDNAVKNPPKP